MSSRELLQNIDPSDLTRATLGLNEDLVGSFPLMPLDKEAGVPTVMCSGCSTLDYSLEEGKTMKRCSRVSPSVHSATLMFPMSINRGIFSCSARGLGTAQKKYAMRYFLLIDACG